MSHKECKVTKCCVQVWPRAIDPNNLAPIQASYNTNGNIFQLFLKQTITIAEQVTCGNVLVEWQYISDQYKHWAPNQSLASGQPFRDNASYK
jgi:hypothetical protein